MNNQKLFNQLEQDGLKLGTTMLEIDGYKVRQRTKWNAGNSGKMNTTRWEVDAKRIAKVDLAKLLNVNTFIW
jgi:hypothetical protein